MGTFECPKCKTRFTIAEQAFAGRTSLRGKCTRCGSGLVVQANGTVESVPATVASLRPASQPGTPPPPAPSAEATRVSGIGSSSGQLPTGKAVSLLVISGPAAGKNIPITKPQVVVGRTGDADIIIEDPEISRKHCAIVVHGLEATLMDLGTTNGTLVDGKRIATHQLAHLSEFKIGSSTIMYSVTGQRRSDDHS